MTVATETREPQPSRIEQQLTTWLVLDGEKIAWAVIFVLAVATRFWDLGLRVMSHDESLHTRFSWDLYRGNGFQHTPLMHGPLLFHMTALSYFLFGDSDFSSRIYPAVIGVLVVMFPLLMRRWLGKLGALAASGMFLISPLMLYYSRYVRHDLPAISFALVIGYSAWRYIEKPEFKRLGWIAAGMALMIASKEVAFIYTAIFGSFLTVTFVVELLNAREVWVSENARKAFLIATVAILVVAAVAVGLLYLSSRADLLLTELETAPPADPNATTADVTEEAQATGPLNTLLIGAGGLAGVLVLVAAGVALWGAGRRLRDFPSFDVLMVMGTLVLPLLTPFAIKAAGFDPMADTVEGIQISWAFTAPVLVISVLLGLWWGAPETLPPGEDGPSTFRSWLAQDLLKNRWWVVGGIYYALFVFFFTTMFTNGNGLGTGVVGSLGYWLEQQGVRRGSQPDYYYGLVMLPIYEFLPLILTLAAGVVGGIKLFGGSRAAQANAYDAPIEAREKRFPVLLFIGYWTVLNFVAYTLAGEKMPWLTTHLTTPMILIGGWLVGTLLAGIEWEWLWDRRGWLLLLALPLATIALARMIAPLAAQQRLFISTTRDDLAATGLWITAFIVFAGALVTLYRAASKLGPGQTLRLAALLGVGALTFQTARAAWLASYINYDEATEYLVYAHSAASVKIVMDRIDEISLRTTDGHGLKVAYDNRVSWPFSWYLRNYEQAIFYGEQPTRSQLSQAPVILAGPDNWAKVEPLIGDRYYKFEYIRMWWPMQDYFDLTGDKVNNFFTNPGVRAGIWEIFLLRDYDAYGEATGKDFTLSNWPVAERMRFYVRKDVFAQVWDYGVTATELAEATDPYAEGRLDLQPIGVIGGQGSGAEELNGPRGLVIGGPEELLYVADSGNHRVQVFTLEGSHVMTIGTGALSEAPGGFNEPWGLDVDDEGNVYVADTWNHRVQQFDASGEFVRAWGTFGQTDEPQAMWGPRDVAIGIDGDIYVTDTGNKRIRVYTPEGEHVTDIGRPGGLDGQLDEPVGIETAQDGRIFVVDTWNQRVQVFNPVGGYLSHWFVSAWYGQSLENKPFVTVSQDNHVYITDPEGFRVLVFDADGTFKASFGDFQAFNLASGIAVDGEGNLYVSDGLGGKVLQYGPLALEVQ